MQSTSASSISADSSVESPKDSFKRRYFYKIIANIFGLVSNLVVASIIPRTLGPKAYGDFNFVTHFFDQIMELIDGRSSVGALVKISFRPRESGLVVFYLYFSFLASFIVFGLMGSALLFSIEEWVWPGQEVKFIALGCLWSVLVWLHGVLHKMCDAFGLTVEAEKVRIFQKGVSIVLLLALFFLDRINLTTFFIYYIGILLFLFVGFFLVLLRAGKWPSWKEWQIPVQRMKSYAVEFYEYTLPLFMYFAFEAIVAVVDRWLLQKYAGSEEQGYFGFAYQMGYIIFLFVGAMSPLIQREFSVSYQERDYAHLAYLFKRYLPLQFAIAVFFGAFICFEADRLISLFAGQDFSESFLPLMVLAFYSVYFTFGRITSSIFFAMGANKLFRNLGVSVLGFGLIVSWVLVASKEYGGLDLGADGLAIKSLIVYFLLINIQLFFNTRLLKLKYRTFVIQQFMAILVFLGLSYLARMVTPVWEGQTVFTGFILSGTLYCLLTYLVVGSFPILVGLYRNDIRGIYEKIKSTFGIEASQRKIHHEFVHAPAGNIDKNKKFRIALLGAASSIHTLRWANSLAEMGHEIHILTAHAPRDELSSKVHLHQFPVPAPLGYFLNIFALRRCLRKIQPDILHTHYASGYGTLGTLSGFNPRITSVWGSDVFQFPIFSVFNEMLVKRNLLQSDWVCSTSKVMAHEVLRIAPELKKNISVIPFGVDFNLFYPKRKRSDDQIVIGCVKSMDFRYGIDVLIRGFHKVLLKTQSGYPEIFDRLKLRIVGGGRQDQFMDLVKDLGIVGRVEFFGGIKHQLVPQYLNDFDIFVGPSRSESFGVAVVEASACGLPVIVSDVGGLPEVVEQGETGYLVPNENVELFSERMLELAMDSELRTQMGEKGRAFVQKKYNWNENVHQMIEIYHQILTHHKKV